jgi:uncharacterized protein YlaI
MGEWGPQVGLLTFHQSTPLPPLGTYLLLLWSRQYSVGYPILGGRADYPKSSVDKHLEPKIHLNSSCNHSQVWYNRGMKDIFKTNPLDSFPSIKFYLCDLCNDHFPAAHLADDQPIHSFLCQPCWDRVQKDSK